MASLSNSGLAHPPRSNPPLVSGPPFPCITPSTETCVVVVSFMIAVSFSLGGAPRGRPLTPATNTSAPIRHRLRISLEDLLVRRLSAVRQRDGFGAPALHFLICAPSADELWDQIDREDPD